MWYWPTMRATWVLPALPGRQDPAPRSIYAQTVAALGYDPLTQRDQARR